MYKIPAVVVLCFLAIAESTYSDCGSKLGKVVEVNITGCKPKDSRCILKRNTNVTISIDFNIWQPIDSVNTVVHGVVMNVPIRFPVDHANACTDPSSGIKCPLMPRPQPFRYNATLPVKKVYPTIPVDVKWELQDSSKQNIVCISIAAKIQ